MIADVNGRETQSITHLQGVKKKKAHEVRQICPFIHSIWEPTGIKTIVDIGEGQGYISEVILWNDTHDLVSSEVVFVYSDRSRNPVAAGWESEFEEILWSFPHGGLQYLQ